jgi:hypothetical protein
MRWLIAIACVVGLPRAAGAVRMFDLGACSLDPKAGPPPVMDHVTLVDAKSAAELAAKLAAQLNMRVELDTAQMATLVEFHVPGQRTAAELAPDILAFVRAHACMFGVVDPAALSAHATGPQHDGTWVLIDLKPRSIGAIQAEVDIDGKTTRVRIEHHLWPIADVTPTIDLEHMLARYIGRAVTIHRGWRYLVDPATHRHRACVPIYRDVITEASTFNWRGGPILVCGKRSAEVRAGAFVWIDPMRSNTDAALAELPTALDPDGNRFASFIAPALRSPDDDSLAADIGVCP